MKKTPRIVHRHAFISYLSHQQKGVSERISYAQKETLVTINRVQKMPVVIIVS